MKKIPKRYKFTFIYYDLKIKTHVSNLLAWPGETNIPCSCSQAARGHFGGQGHKRILSFFFLLFNIKGPEAIPLEKLGSIT